MTSSILFLLPFFIYENVIGIVTFLVELNF